MPAYREAGGFFAAEYDLVPIYQFADELEPDRRFMKGEVSFLCNPVDKVRCRHAACHAEGPTPAFGKVICQQCYDLIRRDEFAAPINDPKSVSVPVCSQSECEAFGLNFRP